MTPRPLLVALLLAPFLVAPSVSTATAPGPLAPEPLFTPHPSITIVGNAGFAGALSGVVAGSGTPTDPFLIRGWDIVHTAQAGIRIEGTTAHVVIEDVAIRDLTGRLTAAPGCATAPGHECREPFGIHLVGAENVLIRHVRVTDHRFNVFVEASRHVTIQDTDLTPPHPELLLTYLGAYVLRSDDVRVARVVFAGSESGLAVRESTNVLVEDSTFRRTPLDSLFLGHSSRNVTVKGNTFVDATVLVDGEHERLSVVENAFLGARSAFRASEEIEHPTRLARALFCGNTFDGSTHPEAALWLAKTEDVHIVGNRFSNVTLGLRLDAGQRGLVEKNAFDDADVAALVFHAGGWAFHHNAIARTSTGLVADAAFPATATHNWWGHPTGPSGLGPGSGAAIVSNGPVPHAPWLVERPTPSTLCP